MSFTTSFLIYGLGGAISRFAAIILVPLYTHELSVAEYGELELLLATHTLTLILAGMQTESAVARDYFDLKSKGLGTDLAWSAVAITCVGVVIISMASYVTLSIGWFPEYISTYDILLILALILPVQMFGIQQAMLRFEGSPKYFAFISFIDLVMSAIFSVFFVAVLHSGPDGALLGLLFGKLSSLAIAWSRTFGDVRNIRLKRDMISIILNYGVPSVPAVIVNWVHNIGNRMIMAAMLPLSEVAMAGVAIKVAAIFGFIVHSYRLAWEPFAIAALSKFKTDLHLYRRCQEWYVLSMFFFAGIATMLSPLVTMVLAPPAYANSAGIAVFFGFGQFWVGMTTIAVVGIQGARRTSMLLPVYLSGLVVNLLFLILGSHFFGALAAGVGFLAGSACSAFIALYLSNKLFNAQLNFKLLVSSAVATVIFSSTCYQVIIQYQESTLFSISAVGTLSAGICLLLVLVGATFIYACPADRLVQMLQHILEIAPRPQFLKESKFDFVSAVRAAGLDVLSVQNTATSLVRTIKLPQRSTKMIAESVDTKYINTVSVVNRFGKIGFCNSFSDASSHAIADDLPEFISKDLAISFWRRSYGNVYLGFISLDYADGSGLLKIDFCADNQMVVIIDDKFKLNLVQNAQSKLAVKWCHISIQLYMNSVLVFVDGEVRLSGNYIKGLNKSKLTLIVSGCVGGLDEIRIYDFALPVEYVPNFVYKWQLVKPTNLVDSLVGLYHYIGDECHSNGYSAARHPSLACYRLGVDGLKFEHQSINTPIYLTENVNLDSSAFAIGFWQQSAHINSMVAISVEWADGTLDIVSNANAAISVIENGVQTNSYVRCGSNKIINGDWHFVLVQRLKNVQTIYVDGVVCSNEPINELLYNSFAKIHIGRPSFLSERLENWKGLLDNIQIYRGSLSVDQIKAAESLSFLPNDGAGLLSFQDRLWLLGGWNPNHCPSTNSEVWSSADGKEWSLEVIAPWEGRHTAGFIIFAGKMWVIGGDKNRGHYQNDVWASVDGVNWDFVTDSVPWAGRVSHSVLVFDDRMWVIGGQEIGNPKGKVIAFNDVYSSNDGKNWNLECGNAQWSPRGMILGSVVHQGYMWIIGGGTYDFRTFNNDIWRSKDGIHWDQVVEAAPWAPRQYHSVATFDDKIWVIAGNNYGNFGSNDVWYSSDGFSWTELRGGQWPQRHACALAVHRDCLWMIGGSATEIYSDVWKLTYA